MTALHETVNLDELGTHLNTALGKHVNSPASCSCWMCGNPRKHFDEKTRQEKIWDNKFSDDLRSDHWEE